MGSNPDLGLGIEPWEGPGHCRATVHVSLSNPFLNSPWAGKEGGSWGRGCYTVGAAPVSVLLSLGHTTAARRGEGFGYRDLLDCRTKDSSSTRMNFAAQLFYSSYLSERLERLYSPRLALKDSEENDPFWQREELRLGPSQPNSSYKCGPLNNGTAGRRPTLIEPERLKDFGEEDLVNGEVKVYETKVMGGPEIMLMDPPKTRRFSEFRVVPKPHYLRFEDISAAAFRIQTGIQKTPCTYSRLSKQYGMEIYLKKEHLHYTGSVKERGVLYLLTSLTQEQQRKGVIVANDCNFSMAVAHHSVELKIPVFVIMPSCCSLPRLRIYRDYGAMVISYGSTNHDSQNHACHLAKENGYLYLEEEESAAYLAGLGTVGMEIFEQVPKLDAVVVPAAGQYGLLAGTAAAIKHLNPQVLVIGIEPEGFPLLLQSLKTDSPVKDIHSNPNKKLYGDLMERSLGVNTFQLAKKLVDKVISVSEEDSLVAMLRFQEFERSTVDTEGAMGLAAILAGQLPELRGKKVAVVVSSANMELELVRQCVDRALVLDDRVSKFSVQLGEWPGDMAKLLDVLSREDVRLLDVCHRRQSDKSDFLKAKVECVVETRDKAQSAQLRKTLSERYPSICWLDR